MRSIRSQLSTELEITKTPDEPVFQWIILSKSGFFSCLASSRAINLLVRKEEVCGDLKIGSAASERSFRSVEGTSFCRGEFDLFPCQGRNSLLTFFCRCPFSRTAAIYVCSGGRCLLRGFTRLFHAFGAYDPFSARFTRATRRPFVPFLAPVVPSPCTIRTQASSHRYPLQAFQRHSLLFMRYRAS